MSECMIVCLIRCLFVFEAFQTYPVSDLSLLHHIKIADKDTKFLEIRLWICISWMITYNRYSITWTYTSFVILDNFIHFFFCFHFWGLQFCVFLFRVLFLFCNLFSHFAANITHYLADIIFLVLHGRENFIKLRRGYTCCYISVFWSNCSFQFGHICDDSLFEFSMISLISVLSCLLWLLATHNTHICSLQSLQYISRQFLSWEVHSGRMSPSLLLTNSTTSCLLVLSVIWIGIQDEQKSTWHRLQWYCTAVLVQHTVIEL